MKISSVRHVITKGRHKGQVRKNPSLKKKNVGLWINTQTVVREARYKDVPTGNYTTYVEPINDDYTYEREETNRRGKKTVSVSMRRPIFPLFPRYRTTKIPETKEVFTGYDVSRRPVWIHKLTGVRIRILPAWWGDNWNIEIKGNDLFWTKIGSHPDFKSAYDLAVGYMQKHK